MIQEKPLETVEISDYASNELFFVADSSFSQMLSLPFLIPIISIVLFSFSSFFLPSSKNIQSQQFELAKPEGNNLFSINNSISNISPIYQFLYVNFSLIDPPPKSEISIVTHSIFSSENNIFKTSLVTFKSKNPSETFTLLDENTINFDNIIIETNFSAFTKTNQSYQISVCSMNPSYSLSIVFCRIAFSLFLIPYIISDVIQLIENPNSFLSSEQILTLVLSLITILYNDPFYAIQFFSPSFYSNFIFVVFRDVYLSYFLFYSFSIFSCFGINKGQNYAYIRMPLNSVLMIISLSALLWFDISSSLDLIVNLAKNPSNVNYSIFKHHSIFLFIISILILIIIFIARSSKSESQSQRFRYYSYSTLFVLASLILFALFKLICPDFINEGFDSIFPMILFTGYAMFMEYGHEDTEISDDKAYVAPEDVGSLDDPVGLGAEEDPEQLKKNAKK